LALLITSLSLSPKRFFERFAYSRAQIQSRAKHVGLMGAILLAASSVLAGPSTNQPRGLQGIANAEVARRQQIVADATAQIAEGDILKAKEQEEAALSAYASAMRMLPIAPATIGLRDEAAERFATLATERARRLAGEGQTAEAGKLLSSVLGPEVAPGHQPAQKLLKEIGDPEIYQVGNTPQHHKNVKEVRSLLLLAADLHDLGQFDEANRTYDKVLAIDRYNSAARRGQQQVSQSISVYLKEARSSTRANMFKDVDMQWETAVPKGRGVANLFGAAGTGEAATTDSGRPSLSRKLNAIRLPNVQFTDARLDEVVQFIVLRARELDTLETDPAYRGVSILIQAPDEYKGQLIDLSLRNVPISEVLRYAADQAGMRYELDQFAIRLVPLNSVAGNLVTRFFKVPPDFIRSEGSGQENAAELDPFAAPTETGGGGALKARLGAREYLEKQGIIFPDGSAASFSPTSSTLMVRNTQDAIDLVETMVDEARSAQPRQVQIRVTMLDVRQENLNELGYDWLLGPFNAGGDKLFGTGGVPGYAGRGTTGINFPTRIPGDVNTAVGINPITDGLRGATDLEQLVTIDSLLGGTERTFSSIRAKSPGAFSVSGVFTDPQFQTVIRAIHQKKGVDLMAAPMTIARSGQNAKIEIVREFIYPIEYDPPEIPNSVGDSDGLASFPVTPATPTTFETRNVGFTLVVEPVISEDNRTVELNLVPESVVFDGFIDYGSNMFRPIPNRPNSTGGFEADEIENDILMPIFRTNRVTTSVTVWDGQTIVIAGLASEESDMVEDKVPLLGSLPGLGQFFTSEATKISKRNIVFFVTVNIVDPGGERLNAPAGISGR